MINTRGSIKKEDAGQLYKIRTNHLIQNKHPNLIFISTMHRVDEFVNEGIPLAVINVGIEDIWLNNNTAIAHLDVEELDISEITTQSAYNSGYNSEDSEKNDDEEEGVVPSSFITSPADIETHRKIHLKDKEIDSKYREQSDDLCEKYKDIFSVDSTDIGKTPLLQMEIGTGDSPLICQKPYTLALKHAEWVKRELSILEEAGVIERSVLPWASPIVIVPKCTAPGEPPKRRLCVDYRALNGLLPPVKKAHSKAKGVLTLVPLPKIDEIYARLQGSGVYSTLDMRSGYHHLVLSKKARPKSAYVTPLEKWEFKRCPFGLAQTPSKTYQ